MKNCLFFLILFFAGCQYDPYADDLTTVKPKMTDIVGTYIFEQQTIDNSLKDDQIKSATIVLKNDSSFVAIKLPNFEEFQQGYRYKGVVFARGKWQISTNGGVANGAGGTDPIWGVDLTGVPDNLQHIEFMGHKPPYKLIITYGDPDEGAVMIFKRNGK
ncbi:MAG TPA: hypothetical protein VHB54_10905 [Mucilaginibacter sp.]|nr:hypothetical protein [Mucilaginibacter sp.]